MPTLFGNFSAQQPCPRLRRHEPKVILVVNRTTFPCKRFPAITAQGSDMPVAGLVTRLWRGQWRSARGDSTAGNGLVAIASLEEGCWRKVCGYGCLPWRRLLALTLVAWLTTACALPLATATPTPALTGSCTLPLPATATDEERIRAVINAEGELVVKQEITALMGLWQEGAYIANAKNTPADAADDQFWLDKDAIRHRYVRTVFPGAPASATPKDLTITITGTTAVVTATTSIGTELSPAGDRWELVKQHDCWLLQSLTYNLERP